MKSIKPGRGPSGMAFIGSIVAVVFGILWIIVASSIMGTGRDSFNSFDGFGGFDMPGAMFSTSGPPDIIGTIFPLFGVLFVIAGIASAVYHYKNARGRDRFSIIDIVDKSEEGDQSDAWIRREPAPEAEVKEAALHPAGKFCTACGQRLDGNFSFCPGCGRDLSKN